MNRRAFLAGLAVLPAMPSRAAPLPTRAERVVCIDWGLAETLLALGVPPVGLAESAGYRQWVSVPPLPDGVTEIGLRSTPNLEMIAALRPDVILSTPQFAAIDPMLRSVAPVMSLATFTDERQPIANTKQNALKLGHLLGREDAARILVTNIGKAIGRLREKADGKARKVLVVVFHDDRHVWVFTKGSLYADVMERAGLVNAWSEGSNAWGIANASVDQLARMEDAALVVVEPVPPSLQLKLEARPPGTLVGEMELFRPGRYRIIPPNWGFGGLTSARRFSDALTQLGDFLQAGHDA